MPRGNQDPQGGSGSFVGSIAQTTGIPINQPLVNGQRVGSFQPVLLQTFVAKTDTSITVNLGRPPSGYLQIGTPVGGSLITKGSKNGTDWTTTTIVLQTPTAGQYDLLVF